MQASQGTILVIEDDQAIRDTFIEILETEGYRVASASNGHEGLVYLKTHELPCLILLDLMMPVKDGFEFRAEQSCNTLWSEVPTIIMSADDRARGRVATAGRIDFLRKPIDLDELLAMVGRYCPESLSTTG